MRLLIKVLEKNTTKIILFLILLLAAFLRFWNLPMWILPRGDEALELIMSHRPLFCCVTVQSTFSVHSSIAKIFPLKTIPQLRVIDATLNLISILFVYLAVKIITNREYALISAFLLSINAWMVWYGRIFVLEPLSMFLISIILFLFFRWYKTKDNKLILAIAFLSGLALDNHNLNLFFLIPFLSLFYFILYKEKVEKKFIVSSLLLLLILVSPYYFKLDTLHNYMFYRNKYSIGVTGYHVLTFSDFNIKRMAHYLSSAELSLFSFIYLIIPIGLYFFAKKDIFLNTSFVLTYMSFMIILIFPLAATQNFALIFSWLFSIFLSKLAFSIGKNKIALIMIFTVFVFLIYFNYLTLTREIFIHNDHKTYQDFLNFIEPQNVTTFFMDISSYDVFNSAGFITNDGLIMGKYDYKNFTCITGEKEFIDPSDFFTKNKLNKDVIVIAIFECERINEFKQLNLTKKFRFYEISIYQ